MRPYTFVFLACYITGSTAAAAATTAQWTSLAEFPQVAAEIDTGSVSTNGDIVEATFRFTYSTSQQSRSSVGQYRSAEVTSLFNCKARSFFPFRRREFSETQSKGQLVGTATLSAPTSKLEKLIPGSMNEIMYDKACSLSKEHGS